MFSYLAMENGNLELDVHAAFAHLTDHIYVNICSERAKFEHKTLEEQDAISCYEEGEYRDLFLRCLEHQREYESPLDKPFIIAVTHPVYMHTSHRSQLRDEQKEDADIFLKRLCQFLGMAEDIKEYANLVLFETAHHYAAFTNTLMEQRIFDRTFFTAYESGDLVEPGSVSMLGEQVWLTAGAYNGRCYRITTEQVKDIVSWYGYRSARGRIYAIQDLVANPPNPGIGEKKLTGILDPERIAQGWSGRELVYFAPEYLLSLDEALAKLRDGAGEGMLQQDEWEPTLISASMV